MVMYRYSIGVEGETYDLFRPHSHLFIRAFVHRFLPWVMVKIDRGNVVSAKRMLMLMLMRKLV